MIIGVSGNKGSGKSTVSKILLDKGFEIRSFAGPLKRIVSEAFGLDMFLLTDQEAKENTSLSLYIQPLHVLKLCHLANLSYYPLTEAQIAYAVANPPAMLIKSPRHLLQVVGTEVFRQCVDKDYWLNAFKYQLDPNKNYISDDARFANEQHLIKDLGGAVIGINRPGLVTTDSHVSEKIDLSNCDYVLQNDSTLDILEKNVEKTFELIKELQWQKAGNVVKSKALGA
jgi:hypothetical protein